MNTSPTIKLSIAFFSGLMLTLAFAPFHWHLLALFSPALLLWSIQNNSRGLAWRCGFVFGIAFFSTSVYWIYISIHQYGDMLAWQALICTVGFILVLALFPAFKCYCYAQLGTDNLAKRIVVFPAIWVLFEFIRSHLFTGFPWVLLGYSQTEGVLSQYAVILGVYGVSFVLCLAAGFIVHYFSAERENIHSCLLSIAGLWLVGYALSFIHWVHIDDKPTKVSIIQGNILPTRIWTEEQVKTSIDIYRKMTASHWDSDIIVWPENAIPLPYQEATDIVLPLEQKARQHESTIITGIPTMSEFPGFYYNSVIAIGRGSGHYHKRNLVPFGEYSPFIERLFDFYRLAGIPISTIMPGPIHQTNLRAKQLSIAAYICYEIAYNHTVRSDFPDANLIVTLNNDGWFGHSNAAEQHLQIGRMRSIQTGRYQLFATNNSTTAIIDHLGRVMKRSEDFHRSSITGTIYRVSGMTPWIWWGDYPLLLMCTLIIAYFLFARGWGRKFNRALNPIS